jgi:hypothetical protein
MNLTADEQRGARPMKRSEIVNSLYMTGLVRILLSVFFLAHPAQAQSDLGNIKNLMAAPGLRKDPTPLQTCAHDQPGRQTLCVFGVIFNHPYTKQSVSLTSAFRDKFSDSSLKELEKLNQLYAAAFEASKDDPARTELTKFWNKNKEKLKALFTSAFKEMEKSSDFKMSKKPGESIEEDASARGYRFNVEYEGKKMQISFFLGHPEIHFAPSGTLPEANPIPVAGSLQANLFGTTLDLASKKILIDRSRAENVFSNNLFRDLASLEDADPKLPDLLQARLDAKIAEWSQAGVKTKSGPALR